MDMDKGRNLKSQERIEVCSTGVETFFFSFSSFEGINRGKRGRWAHIKLNLQVGMWEVEDMYF